MEVVLVSTPWPLYDRPSIQLGTLKSYLRTHVPDAKVQGLHVFLQVAEGIGYKVYHAISKRTWLAECVYGALLFPERKERIEKLFYGEAGGKAQLRDVDFGVLTSHVKEVSDSIINTVDWARCSLVGFSICLCQLTSSLYFMKRVKKAFPRLPVVAGGSMFSGDHSRALLKMFPEVDFVINGEGEVPLTELIGHLRDAESMDDLPPISGVVTRRGDNTARLASLNQLTNLSVLPPPDYDDYFSLVNTFAPGRTFFPTLPAEISRGCWWRSTKDSTDEKGEKGCSFCNLNLQWEGYRSKEVAQVVSEVDHLTRRYRTLSISFVDNLLPLKHSEEFFHRLAGLKKDLSLFGEIRATTPRKVLQAMKAAGIGEVQVGIEALSTRLLKRLRKGVTAIQNMQIMKDCEELGISNTSNLIIRFPGSDFQDVAETLRSLEFAFPFRPLKCVPFQLGLGSPVWRERETFGLKSVSNHRHYGILFPERLCRSMPFMIQSYRGDVGYQKQLWRPVINKVLAWKKGYNALHHGPSSPPVLSFRDGRDFLIVRQRRHGSDTLTHRLVGTSREIYLFCRKHRSLKGIVSRFPEGGEDKIRSFLKMMVEKKIMFEEGGRYLSLAVRVR